MWKQLTGRAGDWRVASVCLCVAMAVAAGTEGAPEEVGGVGREGEPLREAGVSGVVVTPEGRPVAGARVSMIVGAAGSEREVKTVGVGRSRGDGTFRMKLPPANADGDVGGELWIEAEGFGVAAAGFSVHGDGGLVRDVTVGPVRLRPEAPLTVRFVGPDGKAAAGLRVGPRIITEAGVPFMHSGMRPVHVGGELRERLAARTDAEGVCTLRGLPRQSVIQLEILDDERFARLAWNDRVLTGPGATRLERAVQLTAGATVAGHVRYGGTGKAAAGVRLTAQMLSATGSSGWGHAVTNDDGEYEIKQLPRGSYNVCVILGEEMKREWTASAVEVTVAEGERREHQDLTLIKGGVIEGKVVLKDTGAGAAGVPVGLHGPSRPGSGAAIERVVSGADGRFMFRVPAGENAVYVQGPPPEGYLTPAVGSPRALLKVRVGDGETVAVTLELPRDPSPVVSGVVVDEARKPVAGATVSAEGPEDMFDQRFTRTDGAGQFRLAEPKGSKLRASKEGMRTAEALVTRGAEKDLELRIGRVADASALITVMAGGKPVKGARIKLTVWTGEFGAGSADAVTSDERGECLFDGLSADGRYTLEVAAEGFEQMHPELRLTPGQRSKVEVDLEGGRRGGG